LRRTELGVAGNPGAESLKEAANIMAQELGWNQEKVEKEIVSVNNEYITNVRKFN
jgi:glycerol-3-phosphate dehydrogenase